MPKQLPAAIVPKPARESIGLHLFRFPKHLHAIQKGSTIYYIYNILYTPIKFNCVFTVDVVITLEFG